MRHFEILQSGKYFVHLTHNGHVALLQWLLHGPTDAALQYHDTKVRLVVRQHAKSMALEFCPLPSGDFCYILL
jgi:hypothetical protein